MKTLNFLLSAITFIALAGCNNAGNKTLTIASAKPAVYEKTMALMGFTPSNPKYIYKENSSEWRLWHKFYAINGFDQIYEEGFEYVIAVSEKPWNNPPEDAPTVTYQLEDILSKVAKDSEGVPTWMTELPAERTITIASVKPHVSYTDRSYIFKDEINGKGDWDLWEKSGRIESFDDLYEEGYEYVIRMKILYVDDDPHDYLGRRYELLEVVSKTKMQSSAIPDWMIHS